MTRFINRWTRCALSAVLFTFILAVTHWVLFKVGAVQGEAMDYVVVLIGAMGGALMHDKEPA